jgi:hypothetical protein
VHITRVRFVFVFALITAVFVHAFVLLPFVLGLLLRLLFILAHSRLCVQRHVRGAHRQAGGGRRCGRFDGAGRLQTGGRVGGRGGRT